MNGNRTPADGATRTDSSQASDSVSDGVSGIFWVVPEARFDALTSPLVLGRAETCAVRLDTHQVSREHAAIRRDGPLWLLEDLGSKNGTWLNARRAELESLTEQDVLRIGDFVGVVCTLPRAALQRGALFEPLLPDFVLSSASLAALGPIDALAARDLPIIVCGETGTGKELIVRALHERSQRKGRLLAMNCAAVPEAMAESLLFGHRKGAFTGAQGCVEGYLQAAHGGTLLLDEVADLPPTVQAKLLRVLEDRRVTPLGATDAVQVDFRIVAACQEPLAIAVEEGAFRADLYARLKGAEICVPPLRSRRQEIVRLLSDFFQRQGDPAPCLNARLVEALCVYDWPHNVRELKQLAAVLGASGKGRWTLADLPDSIRDSALNEEQDAPAAASPAATERSARRQAWLSRHARELDQLRVALRKHEGNVSLAALDAGVPRHRARRLLAAEAERGDAARK
jgi:transcriptional regulator of acetoin/glycerol metabolism